MVRSPRRGRLTDLRVLDIPPGWTHHIENVGTGELVVLFWANEPFDPNRPDTYFEDVGTVTNPEIAVETTNV